MGRRLLTIVEVEKAVYSIEDERRALMNVLEFLANPPLEAVLVPVPLPNDHARYDAIEPGANFQILPDSYVVTELIASLPATSAHEGGSVSVDALAFGQKVHLGTVGVRSGYVFAVDVSVHLPRSTADHAGLLIVDGLDDVKIALTAVDLKTGQRVTIGERGDIV